MVDKKRTSQLDWEDIRYFLALSQHQTLNATARALRVNHATVSRRIASLEETLGHSLFDRRQDGYVLNPVGRSVHEEVQTMETAACAVFERLDQRADISGLVRITMTRSLADGFVSEHLGGLLAEHPGLCVEIITESRNLSLARHEADLALRQGRPGKGELTIRRIATLTYGFYAHTSYCSRVEAGETPVFAGFGDDDASVPEAAWAARHLNSCRFVMRSNSQASQAAFASGGYGVALLPDLLARRWPDLVSLKMRLDVPSRELWLVMKPNIARIPRVRLVADFLSGLFDSK